MAREAEIPYATVAMVTDYDCWHDDHDAVTVEAVIKVLLQNADNARSLVKAVAPKLRARPMVDEQGGDHALEYVDHTPRCPRSRSCCQPDAVAGRVLNR